MGRSEREAAGGEQAGEAVLRRARDAYGKGWPLRGQRRSLWNRRRGVGWTSQGEIPPVDLPEGPEHRSAMESKRLVFNLYPFF